MSAPDDRAELRPTGSHSAGRIAGLDLLRGFAIGLVIIRHCWPGLLGSSGIIGVVVFFAVSGFLITGVLMSDIQRFGRVRYGRFYRNRAIRLLPALLFFLVFLVGITLTVNPADDRSGLPRALVSALTYTANLPYGHGSRTVSHLWTLSTEEQFYLVWPLLLLLGIRFRRPLVVAVIAAAAVIVVMIGSFHVGLSDQQIYSLPTSWSLAMLIGACARIAEVPIERALRRLPVHRGWLALVAVLGLIGLSLLPETRASLVSYLVLGPAVAVLTVAAIFYLREWKVLPTPWLKPLLALGTISYAAYLWNYAIVIWFGGLNAMTPLRGALVALLTVVAATVSWFAVERPFNRLKRSLDERARERATATAIG